MTATTNSLKKALRRAAGQAILAPSVHNTQPWRFVLRSDSLDVLADRSRQLRVLDSSGRQLHLSAGCALFNARVSLAASGYAVAVQRLPDTTHPDLLARIAVVPDGSVPAELAELDTVIARRQSNRRQFSDDAVPEALVYELIDVAAAEGGTLYPVRTMKDRLAVARLVQQADAKQISNPAYRAELRAWTTADPDRRDGVRAAAVPHVDGSAEDDVPIRDFDTQGAGWLPVQTRSSMNQCLLLLGTMGDYPHAWMQAGEALQHSWLTLTHRGYVASLFTQPIEEPTVRTQLRAELNLTLSPQLLLRVGHAPVTAASLRRQLDDMLEDSTDDRHQ
jgi:hypothetical protein